MIVRDCTSYTIQNDRCSKPALYPFRSPIACAYHWRHGIRRKLKKVRVLEPEPQVEISEHTRDLLVRAIRALDDAMPKRHE